MKKGMIGVAVGLGIAFSLSIFASSIYTQAPARTQEQAISQNIYQFDNIGDDGQMLPVDNIQTELDNPTENRISEQMSSSGQQPQTWINDIYVTNGDVQAAAESNGILYIGGEFTRVGPNTGKGLGIDITNGLPDLSYPKVNGIVNCVVADGPPRAYMSQYGAPSPAKAGTR